MIKRNWEIHRGWMSAPNLHLDPDCPKIVLQAPFHVGPGISIGGLGYGYEPDESGKIKVKSHRHGVVVLAGASLHPGVVIDRGSHRDTVIGHNAKLNAYSFVGHNGFLGRNVMMGVKSSISGSTVVGNDAKIWSHAYVAQHCRIEDGAIIGAFSNVLKGATVGENEVWFGNPAKYRRMRRESD